MPVLQIILNMFSATLCLRWDCECCVLVIQVLKKLHPAFTFSEKQPYSRVTIRSQKVNRRRILLFIFPACTLCADWRQYVHPFLLAIIIVLFFSISSSKEAEVKCCSISFCINCIGLIKRDYPERRAVNTHPLSHTDLKTPN